MILSKINYWQYPAIGRGHQRGPSVRDIHVVDIELIMEGSHLAKIDQRIIY